MFTIEEIKELIKAVDQSSIGHMEWCSDGTKLVISKNAACPQEQPATVPSQSKPALLAEVQQTTTEKTQAVFVEILASTVGTFYAAPEPGAAPFITIGDKVAEGTVVCILEAMKLFNEVHSTVTGEVVEILVKDGDFVEYGQPLFLVKP
ncbi:MAG: acetyl-CoA carboxylase, biotin carboxyl carrier protein [Firmicutes bacterium]|nr:acetyl-CoA carboxylase, biotin carboxyl carrier protein [Bacillota bacterium]